MLATGIYPPEIGGPATYAALLEKELPKCGVGVTVFVAVAVGLGVKVGLGVNVSVGVGVSVANGLGMLETLQARLASIRLAMKIHKPGRYLYFDIIPPVFLKKQPPGYYSREASLNSSVFIQESYRIP